MGRQLLTWVICLVACAGVVHNFAKAAGPDSSASKPKTSGTVSGLLTDFNKEKITVQIDNEEEATDYAYGPGLSQEALTKHSVFPVDRVNVKFKMDGDKRVFTAIEKIPGKPTGVVIGKVIKNYNNFWVSVKPNSGGMIEGFALNFPPEKFKSSHELIKTLKPGDVVAIRYATDFERHRILEMEVRPAK